MIMPMPNERIVTMMLRIRPTMLRIRPIFAFLWPSFLMPIIPRIIPATPAGKIKGAVKKEMTGMKAVRTPTRDTIPQTRDIVERGCFVSFVVDGLTYLADASRYGGDLFNYKLSDFSNVQFGLELNGLSMFLFDYSVGYDVMKSRFDFFVNQIDIVRKRLYSKLGMDDVFKKVSDYVSKKFKCYSFRDMDFDCLIERIPFLNYFLRMNIAGGSIEKHQLLRKVVGILFKDVRDLELFVVPLYDKYDNFKVYSILCFGYKNEFVYYMQDDYGLEFVDKEFLLDKIQSRGLIFGKYRYLPGFYLTTSNSFILKKTH